MFSRVKYIVDILGQKNVSARFLIMLFAQLRSFKTELPLNREPIAVVLNHYFYVEDCNL